MIAPQNARSYAEKHGASKQADLLFHKSCILEIQKKYGMDKEINQHLKAIAMINPQNPKRFAEHNSLFKTKKDALAYHRTCLRELGSVEADENLQATQYKL